jgi:hypothetical protein
MDPLVTDLLEQGGCRTELSGPGKCVSLGRTTLYFTDRGCLTSLAIDDQYRRYAKWMLLRIAAAKRRDVLARNREFVARDGDLTGEYRIGITDEEAGC